MRGGGPRRRHGGRAEMRQRVKRLRHQLQGINKVLNRLGPEAGEGEDPALIRRREALRRRRIQLLLEVDRVQSGLARQTSQKGKRVVQGPRSGVRSIVQGGAPGLGKRA